MIPNNDSSRNKAVRTLVSSKGIILDFDGLLADSEPFHFKAYDTVFRRYGHALKPEEYWVEFTSKGKGIAGEIERYNLKLGVDPRYMRKEKFELYSQFCQSGQIKLFPSARQFIEHVVDHYRLAVASGSWIKDIRSILEHADAEHLLPVILGKESAPKEKPNPDIFLEAARKLDLKPEECVVVEDALKGLVAAHKAGMQCIIIRNRLNKGIDFSDADLVLESLDELIDIIPTE